jgi:uncharacterized protein (TIGR00375 family)
MSYVADLHIHSRFSRACSKELNIPNLARWAKYKGIDLMGTGDCLYPLWQAELKRDLKESNGVYEYEGVKFLPTVEVACIYTEYGRVRRIHILIFLPSLESSEKLSEVLTKKGMNLVSDGRPILGMSSKSLCDLVFKTVPEALIVPAHIWTPWFSVFGSKAGYDKFTDCFGEFSDQVLAVETGLSSEPLMNWRVSQLDNKAIVSFSDAHSLPRLGREVTVIDGKPTFEGLRSALKNRNIIETIEFFPEEGKYHYSGHRNCGVVFDTEGLKKNGEICPVCKRELTLGVLDRTEKLSDRSINDLGSHTSSLKIKIKEGVTTTEGRPGFRMLVQLEGIIAESMNVGVSSKKVKEEYLRMVTKLAPELEILIRLSIEDISKFAGARIAGGVKRVRERNLSITPGFDNTYGKVKIWSDEEKEKKDAEQVGLF